MAAATESQKEATPINKRSLIVDEDAFEEQFLRCHICHEKFNQETRAPKSLPCNHTFCLPCLKQVFDHNPQNQRRSVAWLDETFEGVLKCPECRVEIFLSRTEIAALPPDHRVIQMMDFLSQVSAKSQNVCSKHNNQSLNFFCKKCLSPVCRDCTVLDHKESQGHNIVDVADALKESSTEFEGIEKTGKDLLDKMKHRTDSLANSSKQLDLQERQLKSAIKDTFIEYRLLLERRQEALIKILSENISKQKQQINLKFVEICTQGSELQKLYDSFKTARSHNDISTLFNIKQQMKDKETLYTCTAEANDDELFISSRFKNPSELTFLSEMSGLGEIITESDMELKKPVPAHQLVLLDTLERPPLLYQQNEGEEENEEDEENEGDDQTASTHATHRQGGRLSAATLARLTRRNLQSSLMPSHVDYVDTMEDLNMNDRSASREALASSYLMRIANRLNESAAEMAEVLNEAEATSPETSSSGGSHRRRRPSPSSSSERGSRSGSSRASRNSSGNVRVVRHPHQSTSSSSASSNRDHGSSTSYQNRYSSNTEEATPEQD